MSRSRLRIRVTLAASDPSIWRLIEVDSATTLPKVHRVLQIAMGWRDEHVHMFARGTLYGSGPGDVQWQSRESIDDGLQGLLETDVQIGDILTPDLPVLMYEYDFGDSWTHRLELLDVIDADGEYLPAVLLDGRRRAPVEDSGGVAGYQHTLTALADPAHPDHDDVVDWVDYVVGPWEALDPEVFDLHATNVELTLLDEPAVTDEPAWMRVSKEMVGLRGREFRDYVRRIGVVSNDDVTLEQQQAFVEPFAWLLRRVGSDGITLTSAGWLPPAVVEEAVAELGWADQVWGKGNREEHVRDLFRLRHDTTRFGLLRKAKGRLTLTKAGSGLVDDPAELWTALARMIVDREKEETRAEAYLLYAAELARGNAKSPDVFEAVSWGMGMLGWATSEGRMLPPDTSRQLLIPVRQLLEVLGGIEAGRGGRSDTVTTVGRAFARAVLRS